MCLIYDAKNLHTEACLSIWMCIVFFIYYIARGLCILIYLLEFKSSQLKSPEGGVYA